MGALRGKLAEVSQREADLLARYNSRHPAVVNVEAEKARYRAEHRCRNPAIAQTVKSEYALAKARLSAMEQSMRRGERTGRAQ